MRRVVFGLILALTSVGTIGVSDAQAQPAQTPYACYHAIGSVYRLYTAYFIREPEADGFAFWIDTYSSGRQNMVEISDFFATSEEFDRLYGSINNLAFVNAVYDNVMDRPGDAEGVAYWTGRLDRAELSRGEMMLMFSESREYIAQTGTSAPLSGYFAWFPRGTTFDCGRASTELALSSATMVGGDLLIVNDGFNTERITINSKDHGVWGKPDTFDLLVGEQILWMGIDFNPGFETISISAGSNVSWLLTQYPSMMPVERNPWTLPDVAMSTLDSAMPGEEAQRPIIAGVTAKVSHR